MTLEPLSVLAFGDFFDVSDLNHAQAFVQSGSFASLGDCDVRWQDIVRQDYKISAMEELSSHRRSA